MPKVNIARHNHTKHIIYYTYEGQDRRYQYCVSMLGLAHVYSICLEHVNLSEKTDYRDLGIETLHNANRLGIESSKRVL